MNLHHLLITASAIVGVACGGGSGGNPDASGSPDASENHDADQSPDAGTPDAAVDVDSSCGAPCDEDGDGVSDDVDQCPGTSASAVVNDVGCSDAQVEPTLQETWPPYGLTWTPAGDMGRPGGMTWTYTGIAHGDRFHIYWLPCDDPVDLCGLSLDGPIDDAGEHLVFSAADSDLPAGKLVLINTTQIQHADTTFVALNGRVTLTIVDAADAPIAIETVGALGVTARAATHGVELLGTGFKVTVVGEVQESGSAWTPYQDYFDAAPKPDPYPPLTVSFGGSFYDE
jgi:hypothetical protein